MFQPVSREKVSLHIIDQNRRAILEARLTPGDSLPPERQMTAQFGVSKHTLREALRALEAMGLLSIRKGAGGGPVVREVGLGSLRQALANFFNFRDVSIADLTQVRKLLEPSLARAAAQNPDHELVSRLRELNELCRRQLEHGQPITGGQGEIDFHMELARASGNEVLVAMLDFVNHFLAELKLALSPGLEFSWRVLENHQRIVEAIAVGDGEAAARLMHEHVCEVERDFSGQGEKSSPRAAGPAPSLT